MSDGKVEIPVAAHKGQGGVRQGARHRDALQRHGLQSFFELSRELDCSQDTFAVADLGLLNFMGHLGTAHAALWMNAADGVESAVLVRQYGISDEGLAEIGATCIARLLQHPHATRRLLRVGDSESGFAPAEVALLEQAGIAVVATLGARGTVWGVVALGERAGAVPHDAFDIDVLQASIDLLGVALDNARLCESLRESNRKLRHANVGLQETNHARAEFMVGMQQQLRAPLSVMYAYLEALAEELPQDGEPHAHTQVAMNQAIKLKRIVLDLLSLSGLKEENLVTQVTPGDLLGTARAFVEERRPGLSLQLRELRIDIDYDAPQAPFDGRRLCQILDILVDHAVKLTPSGGCVTVHVGSVLRRSAHWARIDVCAEGPAVPPEQLRAISGPFAAAVNAEEDEAKVSTAIAGVALARQLAEAMGGWLEVTSDARGTVFSILLAVV